MENNRENNTKQRKKKEVEGLSTNRRFQILPNNTVRSRTPTKKAIDNHSRNDPFSTPSKLTQTIGGGSNGKNLPIVPPKNVGENHLSLSHLPQRILIRLLIN
jgi:hypothetical protein